MPGASNAQESLDTYDPSDEKGEADQVPGQVAHGPERAPEEPAAGGGELARARRNLWLAGGLAAGQLLGLGLSYTWLSAEQRKTLAEKERADENAEEARAQAEKAKP
jgi:hypothetical protein